jgi:hypothetical protein
MKIYNILVNLVFVYYRKHYFFSGLLGTAMIFHPEANTSFFSVSPTNKQLRRCQIFEDYQEKQTKGRAITNPALNDKVSIF